MARDVIIATRWLQKPQPISNRPVGLGFPHPAGRYQPGRSAFTCADCWSCRDSKGFKTCGWELILSRCGGTAALARDAILAARWLQKSQPISNRPVGLGFSHPAGRYRPWRSTFTSLGCWSCRDVDGCLTRGWERIFSRVRRDRGVCPRGNPRRAMAPEAPANRQSASGCGFPHPSGRYRPGRFFFAASGCWSCRDMEGFKTHGCELTISRCGGTAALARGATLATRWLQRLQPISNRPVGLGFPHRAGRYQPGNISVTAPGCKRCRGYERFLTRGREPILPGCGMTAALARDAILAARWLQKPQPISNRPVELGFPHPAGRYRPGGSTFTTPGCWSCRDMDGCLTRGWERIIHG